MTKAEKKHAKKTMPRQYVMETGVCWTPGTMIRKGGTVAKICKCAVCGAWGTHETDCCKGWD